LPLHNVVPNFILANTCEVNRHELVIHRCQCDTQRGRDNNVRASGDEFSVQMIQVVFEASLHHCLKRLLSEDQGVFIVTIKLHLIHLFDFVQSF